MKKNVGILVSLVVAASTMLGACGNDTSEGNAKDKSESFKVGMVTDSGTIDDKSFNQGAWEGLNEAAKELKLDSKKEVKYLKPIDQNEVSYMNELQNLYDAGFKLIVAPGFKLETSIYKAQSKYEDAKFVILDGVPHSGDFKGSIGENTVSVTFAEEQAGFLAAIAAAVEKKEGKFGFIGGMQMPVVQRFNWGFQQGIQYANENLGTNITMNQEDVVYEGTFTNVAGGQQIAAQMYGRGVSVIFTAAGGVGIGAINEAKTLAKAGKEAWVVGVDSDQYSEGIYEGDKSVVLTSAMKKVNKATKDIVLAASKGEFPGGQSILFDVTNQGVGLPESNPNLSDETIAIYEEVYKKLESGDIKVSKEQGNLIK